MVGKKKALNGFGFRFRFVYVALTAFYGRPNIGEKKDKGFSVLAAEDTRKNNSLLSIRGQYLISLVAVEL